MRKGAGAFLIACVVGAIGPSAAGAAITLGYTESSNTACASPGFVDVQTAVPSGVASYTVPAGGGVITRWQHQARDIDGAQLRLKVLRPLGPRIGPVPFRAVGQSRFEGVSEPKLYNFPTRIPVQAGDMIGLVTASNAASAPPACFTGSVTAQDEIYEGPDFAVGSSSTLAPFNTLRLNIRATLERDPDGDGYGNETQDKCPKRAANRAGGCPKKKRCKRRKGGAKRSAVAAKKKKCGRKKGGRR